MDFSKINLDDHQDIARMIVLEAVERTFRDRSAFQKFRNRIIKRENGRIFHNLYFVKAYQDLIKEGKIESNEEFLGIIQKRKVRTMSGVAPLTVLTKPYPCPGKCTYCPTDTRMPKSYLPSQPAAQRGFRQRFDPYSQVYVRLKALEITGHKVSKVELRILGGTWSAYPRDYQTWFIKRCLQAINEYKAKGQNSKTPRSKTQKIKVKSRYGADEVNTLKVKSVGGGRLRFEDVVKENETATVRCIGINIETRPDWVDMEEIKRLRKLGVTKVEMGVQTTDDRVQELSKRGHNLEAVRRATRLFKNAGFKVSYHMMPNLEGTTAEKDKRMIAELFADDQYQPDYLKIYPCVVLPRTSLAVRYRKGIYKPYDDETLYEVLYENMKSVPEWCRIDRVARDIPADEIEVGFKVSNIRQVLEKRLRVEGMGSRVEGSGSRVNGLEFREIRSREIGEEKFETRNVKLITRKYMASGGTEIFLSFEDVSSDKLIALLRLRLSNEKWKMKKEKMNNKKRRTKNEENDCLPELRNAALIREVHVYGKQAPVGANVQNSLPADRHGKIPKLQKSKAQGNVQHMGFGAKLMAEAEKIAKEAGYNKIAVIAGIGTREYYRKFNYRLEGTYMIKTL